MKRLVRRGDGFTLVEVTIVIVIMGVLAAFGIPRLKQAVERSRVAEAFHYLSSVQVAQGCYQSRWGTYAEDVNSLDIRVKLPEFYDVSIVTAGDTTDIESSWRLTLTRAGGKAGYEDYKVVFTEDGFDPTNSTIPAEILPT